LMSCESKKADKDFPIITPVHPVTCDTTNITYDSTIAPIFSANCTKSGCHNTTDMALAGNVALDTWTGVNAFLSNTRSGGPTKMLNDINQVSGGNNMPKSGGKISDCNIKQITKWIASGWPQH